MNKEEIVNFHDAVYSMDPLPFSDEHTISLHVWWKVEGLDVTIVEHAYEDEAEIYSWFIMWAFKLNENE